MQVLVEAAISGFNHFLAEQQRAPGHARLTLVLFDDEYLVPVQSIPVVEGSPTRHHHLRPSRQHRAARRHRPHHRRARRPPRRPRRKRSPGQSHRRHPHRRPRERLPAFHLARRLRPDQAPDREVRLGFPLPRRQPGRHRHRIATEHRREQRRLVRSRLSRPSGQHRRLQPPRRRAPPPGRE